MEVTTTKIKPRGVFSKEVKRVDITDATPEDRKRVFEVIANCAWNKGCVYEIYVNRTRCYGMESEAGASAFTNGFAMALGLDGIRVSPIPDYQYGLNY
jgi:hypothetical protein